MQDLCLVIPCFNEARRLPGDEILRFLAEQSHCSVCFVNDGSTDGTLTTLEALAARAPEKILVVNIERNGGKAEAVRRGVLHALQSGEFARIGYWDADLSTPFSELTAMTETLDRNPACLLAMGSRFKGLGASIERRVVRHYLGRVFATTASLILKLPVYDTQCGAKLFRAEVAGILFHEPFISPWLFDVELLARMCAQMGRDAVLRAVIEVPLKHWRDVGGSKLRPSHLVAVPIGLLRIQWRYRGTR